MGSTEPFKRSFFYETDIPYIPGVGGWSSFISRVTFGILCSVSRIPTPLASRDLSSWGQCSLYTLPFSYVWTCIFLVTSLALGWGIPTGTTTGVDPGVVLTTPVLYARTTIGDAVDATVVAVTVVGNFSLRDAFLFVLSDASNIWSIFTIWDNSVFSPWVVQSVLGPLFSGP